MPVDAGHPRRELHDVGDRHRSAEVLHVIEPHAAKALLVEALHFSDLDAGRQQRDAAVAPRFRGDQVGGGRVVEPMRARLHHHAALDEKEVVHIEQLFLGCVGRRVGAVLGERELRLRPEDVKVRVAGAIRQLELGLGRVRVVRERGLGHDADSLYGENAGFTARGGTGPRLGAGLSRQAGAHGGRLSAGRRNGRRRAHPRAEAFRTTRPAAGDRKPPGRHRHGGRGDGGEVAARRLHDHDGTCRELIAYLKAQGSKLTFPSAGNGSMPHLAGEIFKSLAGVELVHVPYKGSGQSMQDLLGGQHVVAFDTMPASAPHVRSGRLRALAVSSAGRLPAFPDVPTAEEAGLPGYRITTWYGVFAPAGTPAAIVRRLHADTVKAMQSPETRSKLEGVGADGTVSRSPEEFAALVRADTARYAGIVKRIGLKID